MNAIEQGLIISDLKAARGNASLAQSHLLGAKQLCALHGLDVAPLNLAKYHFEEAARLIDQSLGHKPNAEFEKVGTDVPGGPQVGSSDTLARLPGEGSAEDTISNPQSAIEK